MKKLILAFVLLGAIILLAASCKKAETCHQCYIQLVVKYNKYGALRNDGRVNDTTICNDKDLQNWKENFPMPPKRYFDDMNYKQCN